MKYLVFILLIASVAQAGFDVVGNLDVTGTGAIAGLGTGGYTDYDFFVGDTDGTPTYGIMQVGRGMIGMTSHNAADIDLDRTMIFRNIAGPITGDIEFIFVESSGTSCRFALPKSAVGNATYNPRSLLIAGPAPADTDFVKVAYWQTQGIFHNLVCDTVGSGAELGVQGKAEFEDDIFCDSFKESTSGAGITFNNEIIIAPPGQDYKITSRANTDFLAIEGQTDDTDTYLEIFSKKGDEGDRVGVRIFGLGEVDDDPSNRSFLDLYWLPGSPFNFMMETSGSGTYTKRDFQIGSDKLLILGSTDGIDIVSTWKADGETCTDLGAVTTADINGGTIDATTIGGSTPAAGTFTTLEVDGPVGKAIETVTGNTTLDNTHSTLLVNASGSITVTLPTAASAYNSADKIGRIYTVKKIDADADTVTIDGNGSETIDGATTAVLTKQWESIDIQSNGTAWYIK